MARERHRWLCLRKIVARHLDHRNAERSCDDSVPCKGRERLTTQKWVKLKKLQLLSSVRVESPYDTPKHATRMNNFVTLISMLGTRSFSFATTVIG
jgi:hypothetical protein